MCSVYWCIVYCILDIVYILYWCCSLMLYLYSILFLILRKWQALILLIPVTFVFQTWVYFGLLFLMSCYSSKSLLIFYLAFLIFLIRYFLLSQSNCLVVKLDIISYIFLLILFFLRNNTNFQKCLISFVYSYGFLFRKS